MRPITTHVTQNVEINAVDEPGPGGACHLYRIDFFMPANTGNPADAETIGDFREIAFQKGPIKEAGVNGIPDEALYAILIDRLQGFQKGQYSCRENAVALTHLETALMWAQKRTRDREARGVEGTSAA